MSLLTTSPIKVWPAAANSLAVTTGASIGLFNAWTELIPASSIVVPIAIVGIVTELYNGETNGGDILELQFGTGAAGAEVAISSPLSVTAGLQNCAFEVLMFPVAIANIDANARLALRLRSAVNSTTYHFALMYSEALPDDGTTAAAYQYAPAVTGFPAWSNGGVILTPNAAAWGNSDWVEVVTLLGRGSTLLGVAPDFPGNAAYDGATWEIDIGLGDAGSEVVVTTLRNTFSWFGSQGFMNTWLPAGYPVATDTRVAFRLRVNVDTPPAVFRAHLIYLERPATPPAPPTTTFPTVRERVFALPFETNLYLFLQRIEFLVQAGEGLPNGQGSDPRIAVWFSKDGGKTYGNGYTLQAGRIGEYDKRSYLNRLGRARSWVCKIRVSDPVFWAFLDAYADLEEGSS